LVMAVMSDQLPMVHFVTLDFIIQNRYAALEFLPRQFVIPVNINNFNIPSSKINVEFYSYRIGGLQQKIVSDIKFPLLESIKFLPFCAGRIKQDATYYFEKFNPHSSNLSSLSNSEKKALSKTIGFPKRWLENETLKSDQIREVVNKCLVFPEFSYIGLCWNRILIQNFNTNEFYFFYPQQKLKSLHNATFLAGFRNSIWGGFAKYSAMLTHGAAAIIKGKAVLFLASDEGGKTTTVSQFDKKDILNDDQLLLRKRRNKITIHSTPFGTVSCGPASAPLGGIFLIHKSPFFKIEKADPKKIVEFIWNEHMINSIIIPKQIRSALFDLLCETVKQNPVYNLFLKKGELDMEAIGKSI
jgi:hypothetical protein